MAAPRVTQHQKRVLDRVTRMSGDLNLWVSGVDSGAAAACEHLYQKGYLERREVVGPRGGRTYQYRPIRFRKVSR